MLRVIFEYTNNKNSIFAMCEQDENSEVVFGEKVDSLFNIIVKSKISRAVVDCNSDMLFLSFSNGIQIVMCDFSYFMQDNKYDTFKEQIRQYIDESSLNDLRRIRRQRELENERRKLEELAKAQEEEKHRLEELNRAREIETKKQEDERVNQLVQEISLNVQKKVEEDTLSENKKTEEPVLKSSEQNFASKVKKSASVTGYIGMGLLVLTASLTILSTASRIHVMSRTKLDAKVDSMSNDYGIDSRLVHAIIDVNGGVFIDDIVKAKWLNDGVAAINVENKNIRGEGKIESVSITEDRLSDLTKLVRIGCMEIQSCFRICQNNIYGALEMFHSASTEDFRAKVVEYGREIYPEFEGKDEELFNYVMKNSEDLGWLKNFSDINGECFSKKVLDLVSMDRDLMMYDYYNNEYIYIPLERKNIVKPQEIPKIETILNSTFFKK